MQRLTDALKMKLILFLSHASSLKISTIHPLTYSIIAFTSYIKIYYLKQYLQKLTLLKLMQIYANDTIFQ